MSGISKSASELKMQDMKLISEKISGQYAILNLQELDHLMRLIRPSDYTERIKSLSGFTIGNHIRHILEFYGCLLYQGKQGHMSYDSRERNLILETELGYARVYVAELISQISSAAIDQEIMLEAKTGVEDDSTQVFKSSFRRELYYCFEHSIHHQALIKIALRELGKEELVSENFGVAPSTVRHLLKKSNL